MTNCAAILRRRGVSFFRVVRGSSGAAIFGLAAGASSFLVGAAGADGAAGEGGGACAGGAFGASAGGAGAAASALAGSAGFSAGAPPGSIMATTWSILTSSPSAAWVLKIPDSGAFTSVETLSVSSVKSTSPEFTASPSFLCHVERIPDVIDSPTVGTLTSTFIKGDGTTRLRRPA